MDQHEVYFQAPTWKPVVFQFKRNRQALDFLSLSFSNTDSIKFYPSSSLKSCFFEKKYISAFQKNAKHVACSLHDHSFMKEETNDYQVRTEHDGEMHPNDVQNDVI